MDKPYVLNTFRGYFSQFLLGFYSLQIHDLFSFPLPSCCHCAHGTIKLAAVKKCNPKGWLCKTLHYTLRGKDHRKETDVILLNLVLIKLCQD